MSKIVELIVAESDWIKQGLIHELWDFEDGPNADKQEEVYSNRIKYIRAILDGYEADWEE